MRGAFYINSVNDFLTDSNAIIRDKLTEGTSKHFYQQLSSQTDSWDSFITLVKEAFSSYMNDLNGGILLEYPIPRRSKRIDCVVIVKNLIIVIEFKDGQSSYLNEYIVQLEDYCLDLRDFHRESQGRNIIPVLFCPNGVARENVLSGTVDQVKGVVFANKSNISTLLFEIVSYYGNDFHFLDYKKWNESDYFPTPTIIEAAQSLYSGHSVSEITRSHAGVENLTNTTRAIINAIKEAQKTNSKIICFITGVPGAGKTLAGLNIIHNREFKSNDEEIGVFLSGNSPLIKVLTEALARDVKDRESITKKKALRKITTFIHNVHQFIDDNFDKTAPPVDRVLVYDEAQRAWTKEYKSFKSEGRINASEPDVLLSIMDKFENSWAVIIALVGVGQEINTGEGGLAEWGKAISEKYTHWKVYISPQVSFGNDDISSLYKVKPSNIFLKEEPFLHLDIPIRSYKANDLSKWVNCVLNNEDSIAKKLLQDRLSDFPLYITRSLNEAKYFLKHYTRGSRRSGLLATSGAKRLRALGLDMAGGLKGTSSQDELGAWFLNPANDVRSSNFLEIVGSEFGVQGLELDISCVCWDADLRRENDNWSFKFFTGTSWKKVSIDNDQRRYILNKYRVLLTRSREGMIVFVPEGDDNDYTRLREFYDPIFYYLKSCGLRDLSDFVAPHI